MMKRTVTLISLLLCSILSSGQYNYPKTGGSGSRSTAYGYGGNITGGNSWCSVTRTNNLLSWTVSPNTTFFARSTYIQGTELNSESSYVAFSIQITQAPADVTQPPTNPPNTCSSVKVNGPDALTAGVTQYAYYTTPLSGVTYTWAVSGSGPVSIVSGQGTANIVISTDPNVVGAFTVSVYASNSCSASKNIIPL